ncbi:MAG TPA: CDP-diacylglycerol--serine O-phosphatidyltransferase [Chitinophagales bacterium]|nr:CDP-diacylglycerol--serine O-phosphatidyltransferase [Chitinophagales bacterium]
MKLKEQIANFFTLLNLACGTGAIFLLSELSTVAACLLVFAGAFFDLLDGLAARALKITSDIGKQLDSLSDMVTFGIVPGLIAHHLMAGHGLDFIAMLIPAFSAIRLAKFNIDSRQSKDFIGMPTPANALLWASFGIMSQQGNEMFGIGRSIANFINQEIGRLLQHHYFIIACIILTSLLLVSPIHIMGFKFNQFTWKGNEVKFILVSVSLVLILFFGITGIPFIIILYPLFSILNRTFQTHEVQS